MVLVASCPKQRAAPRLNELFVQRVPGSESALHHCLVLTLFRSEDIDYGRDAVRDLSGHTKSSPTDAVAAVRPSPTGGGAGRRRSPVLRPDSTVMSEERGGVRGVSETANEHEPKQRRSSPGSADCVGGGGGGAASTQRPAVWNPFVVDVTAAAGTGGDSEDVQVDGGTTPPAVSVVGTATKHSRSNDDNDDDTRCPAKRRKTDLDGGSVELSDTGRRPSGQSPSSSTPDAGAALDNGSSATVPGGTQDSAGVCVPDSSCDQQSSTTSDVKRFDSVAAVKETTTHRPAAQKDFTTVGGIQETGSSLLPLATQ